jgi:hypothetical protein
MPHVHGPIDADAIVRVLPASALAGELQDELVDRGW